jgi:hypothetical protein
VPYLSCSSFFSQFYAVEDWEKHNGLIATSQGPCIVLLQFGDILVQIGVIFSVDTNLSKFPLIGADFR